MLKANSKNTRRRQDMFNINNHDSGAMTSFCYCVDEVR